MEPSDRCHSCGNPVTLQAGIPTDACVWCGAAWVPVEEPQGEVPSPDRWGKYVRTERLGAGGMGEVWKAFDSELNRWVALKFLKDQQEKELARFQREARVAAGISHPGIAAVFEVGQIDGRHFIAMQYIEGIPLGSYPRKDRRRIVELIRDAARAIEHAHRLGIIHRDLKPENLMVDSTCPGGRLVILDFGLARPIQGGERLSLSGDIAGTPAYMSPEQARGEALDVKTDIYSLGATLYHLATGLEPFRGGGILDVIKKVEGQEIVPPRTLDPTISRDLETIILKCMEKNPGRRYASSGELADDLDRWLGGEAIRGRRAGALYRLRMKLGRKKAAVLAVAALALSAGLAAWWINVERPRAVHLRNMADGMRRWNEARVAAVTGVDSEKIRRAARAARESFERALRAAASAEAELMTAKCLELEGRDEEALKALERSHARDSTGEEARVELAKALFLKYLASRGTPSSFSESSERDESWIQQFGERPAETSEQKAWRERGEALLKDGVAPLHANLLEGLRIMCKGRYEEAADRLGAYTKSERWDAQALRLEGMCRFFAQDHAAARGALTASLDRVLHADGFFWRACVHHAVGHHADAIADYSRALESNPHHLRALIGRGLAKHAGGLHDEAIEDFTGAITAFPRDSTAYVNRGIARFFKGLHTEAISDFTQAVELNPRDAASVNNRGSAMFMTGRYDEAIEDFTRAITLNSKYAMAYFNRGLALEAKQRWDEAIADLKRALEVAAPKWPKRGEVEARLDALEGVKTFHEAEQLMSQRKYRDSADRYKRVAETLPGTREALVSAYNAACCHALLGETPKALDWLEKAVSMGWTDAAKIEADPDLESLREETRYKDLVSRLKSE